MKCKAELQQFCDDYAVDSTQALRDAMINYDILITQLVYFGAIMDYVRDGGKSRGSYFIMKEMDADLLAQTPEIDTEHAAFVQNTVLDKEFAVTSFFEPCRPLPASEQWFEKVWNQYRAKQNS